MRVHRNCLVARDAIRGFERRVGDEGDAHWEVLLKGIPETLPVSRRQQSDRPRDRPRKPARRRSRDEVNARRRRGRTSARLHPRSAAFPRHVPRTLDLRLARLRHHHGVPRSLRAAHPAGADAHAVGVVPDRRDAPRMGRLRRQHRVQPEGARRRARRDGDARRRRRAVSRAARRRWASRATACARLPEMFTAQAFIITDLDDNQITAFHPGAMNASHENRVGDVADIALGIVAPDGRDGMRSHVEQFAQREDSVRVRSGPGIAAVLRAGADRDDRRGDVRRRQRLRGPAPGRAHRAVARGDRAARRRADRDAGRRRLADPRGRRARSRFRPCTAAAVVDPTGCGDAFRAGLLYGIVARLGLGAHRAPRGARWARSRSRRAAARITRSAAIASRALYYEAFHALPLVIAS